MNYNEEYIIMDEEKQQDLVNIISNLKQLDEALDKCKSKDIFKSIAQSSSNFFYEIIQNADDAGATELEFNIYQNKIIIKNNGRKFKKEDILKLCGVNHEKENKGLIGRFGVGFKIAYTLAKRVDLYSNGYYLKIQDFINVSILNKGNKEFCNDNTIFVLHLYENDEEYYSQTGQSVRMCRSLSDIIEGVREFEINNFIFLNNLNKIKVVTNDEILFDYNKEKEVYEKNIEGKVIKYFDKVKLNQNEKYIVFKSQSDNDNEEKRYLKIAYKLDENENIISQYIDGKTTQLYSFFPLKSVNTGLNFMIQGNFTTDITRMNLDFALDINKDIIDGIVEAIGESIVHIIKIGLRINYDLYPLSTKSDVNNPMTMSIYNKIVKNVIETFSKEEVVMGREGIYHKANDILKVKLEYKNAYPYYSQANELNSNCKKIKNIFEANLFSNDDKTCYWIDDDLEKILDSTSINDNSIISKIGIKEICINDVISMITGNDQMIKDKDDNWLIDFYIYLFYDKQIINCIKSLNLYKTLDDNFVSIINNKGDLNLYLKISENIGEKVVDSLNIHIFNSELLKNKKLFNIIKNNDILIDFNVKDIVQNIVEQANDKITYQNEGHTYLNDKVYFETLSNIIKYIRLNNKNSNKDVIQYLKGNFPISGCRNLTDYLLKKDSSYYYCYLNNSSDIHFHWDDMEYFELFSNKKCEEKDIKPLTINNNSQQSKHYLIDSKKYKNKLSEDDYIVWVSIINDFGIKKGITLSHQFSFTYGYEFIIKNNENRFANRIQPKDYYNPVNLFMPSVLYIKSIVDNITIDNSIILWNILCELYTIINFNTEAYVLNYYGQQVERIDLENEFIYILQNSKWIYGKDGKIYDPFNLKFSDLDDKYFRDENKDINKHKRLCNILGISLDSKKSIRSTNIQRQVDKLNNEQELRNLLEYINERIVNINNQ